MSSTNPTPNRTAPVLADLLARYLGSRVNAPVRDAAGEIEPYEVASGLRGDPRTAWDDATAAVRAQQASPAPLPLTPPAEWAGLTETAPSAAALPFAAGHFAQQVRDLTPLLQAEKLSALRPAAPAPAAPASTALQNWAFQAARQHGLPSALIAAGVLRLAGQTGLAGQLLTEVKAKCPGEWRTALANEEAALAWAEGRWADAAERWLTLPVSVPVLFNRGLADLFLDRPAEARASFRQAIAQLPETSPWHHLAELYLALAELRG
jgi:tetratricopeptide (TPR) repeat protein